MFSTSSLIGLYYGYLMNERENTVVELNNFLKYMVIKISAKSGTLLDCVNTYKEIDEQREELPKEVAEEVEIEVKYKGYIKLQQQQVEKFKKLERKLLPQDIDYTEIKGLRLEARQKYIRRNG